MTVKKYIGSEVQNLAWHLTNHFTDSDTHGYSPQLLVITCFLQVCGFSDLFLCSGNKGG